MRRTYHNMYIRLAGKLVFLLQQRILASRTVDPCEINPKIRVFFCSFESIIDIHIWLHERDRFFVEFIKSFLASSHKDIEFQSIMQKNNKKGVCYLVFNEALITANLTDLFL